MFVIYSYIVVDIYNIEHKMLLKMELMNLLKDEQILFWKIEGMTVYLGVLWKD